MCAAGLAPLFVRESPNRALRVVHWMRVRAKVLGHLGDAAGAAAMREACRMVALELVPIDIELDARVPAAEFGVTTWPVSLR